MIRPTTKDLAVAAGVSLATVDRVLNNRPNVSPKTRDKVNRVIDDIGFSRNMAAVNLIRNRPYRFRFVLPSDGDQFLATLIDRIRQASDRWRDDMTQVEITQLDMSNPYGVAQHLGKLTADEVDGVAVKAPSSPQVRDALSRLKDRGIHCVQFLSSHQDLSNTDVVGIDNFAAGATAGLIIGRFCGNRGGTALVINESMNSTASIERRHGFDRVINNQFPLIKPSPTLETYSDKSRTQRILNRQFNDKNNIIAVYAMYSDARETVEALRSVTDLRSLVVVAHERTPFNTAALKTGEIDAVIAQHPGHAVRSAVRILRARAENRDPMTEQDKLRIEILLAENV